MPVEEQVISIYAGVNGYLDKVDVKKIGAFEEQLLTEVRSKHADILTAIRDSGDLSPETVEKLKALLDAFTKTFA